MVITLGAGNIWQVAEEMVKGEERAKGVK